MYEILLIEEFKNCVPERTALQKAAVLAEEYALMHKPVFLKLLCDSRNTSQKENEISSSDSKIRPNPSSLKTQRVWLKVGHMISKC